MTTLIDSTNPPAVGWHGAGNSADLTVVGADGRTTNIREADSMRIRWRGLELPSRVQRDASQSSPRYGRFFIEPFERGFGTTVGNSLRRILLSSLEGAAVTSVRIAGVEHEFSSIVGVLEDVTAIILNIKSLIVRLDGEGPQALQLSVQGRKGEMTEVRASRFEGDASVEIVNGGQLVATLTTDVKLEIEITVDGGRGYRTAEDNKSGEQVVGVIPVDSAFSPVTRVRYRVEDTRVGQRTNYDRLIMEIWTKGTVTPEMALVEAAKILRKHLNPFVQYSDAGEAVGVQTEVRVVESAPAPIAVDENTAAKLAMPISELDLSVRASNCLDSAKIATVGDLIAWTEPDLLKLRSFGKTSLREVKRKLSDIGLSLTPSGRPPMDEGDDDDDEIEESVE